MLEIAPIFRKQVAEILVLFLTIFISLYLQAILNFPPVIAAASVALIGAFILIDTRIKNLMYVGTFCSMGVLFHSSYFVLHAIFLTLISYMAYSFFESRIIGFGGKLGSIAFVSCLIYFIGLYALN